MISLTLLYRRDDDLLDCVTDWSIRVMVVSKQMLFK